MPLYFMLWLSSFYIRENIYELCFLFRKKKSSQGQCKCIKHFIKHYQTCMFDEMFDAFEMNHNFKKFRKEEKTCVWRCLMKFVLKQTFHQTNPPLSNQISMFDAFELNFIKQFVFYHYVELDQSHQVSLLAKLYQKFYSKHIQNL